MVGYIGGMPACFSLTNIIRQLPCSLQASPHLFNYLKDQVPPCILVIFKGATMNINFVYRCVCVCCVVRKSDYKSDVIIILESFNVITLYCNEILFSEWTDGPKLFFITSKK